MPDELDKLPMDEYKKARANGATVEEPEVKEEQEQQEDKPKAKGGGFQKRIERMTRINASQAEEIERYKRMLEEKRETQVQQAQAKTEGEPQRDQFQSDIDYYRALTRWEVRQETAKEEQRKANAAAEAERKEVFDRYNKAVSVSMSEHDDFKEVVGQDINIPQGVQLAIIEMDNGPEVAYFLGKNPEFCDELMNMTQFQAIGKIWAISEKLKEETPAEEEETEEEEKPTAKAEEKPKHKFEPIKPASGGGTRSSKKLEEMSMADYKKARAAGRTS